MDDRPTATLPQGCPRRNENVDLGARRHQPGLATSLSLVEALHQPFAEPVASPTLKQATLTAHDGLVLSTFQPSERLKGDAGTRCQGPAGRKASG